MVVLDTIGPACSYVVHEDLEGGAGEGEREGRKREWSGNEGYDMTCRNPHTHTHSHSPAHYLSPEQG